jgi:hypothetical protein
VVAEAGRLLRDRRGLLFESPPASGTELIVVRRAGSEVNSAYFASYTEELGAGVITELTYLNSPRISGRSARDLPYGPLVRALEANGVADQVFGVRPERLVELRSNPDVVAAILATVTKSSMTQASPGHLVIPEAEP